MPESQVISRRKIILGGLRQVRTCRRTITSRNLRQVQQVRVTGVMIPIRTHLEVVAGTLTMETIAFSVRLPMMSKDKELAPDRGGSESGFRQGHLDFIR